tara:strand:+ start:1643 stop:1888 length:246 start_codon:yes stop_codon:yes gene_type:complete
MTFVLEESILKKINEALEEIRPFLAEDGGDIEFVELTDEWLLKVRFIGACSSCSISDMTLKNGVETILKKALPQIKQVVEV